MMAEIDVPPLLMGARTLPSNSSVELEDEAEEETYWIHWKDPYWKTVDGTPQPDSTTVQTDSGTNGTGARDLFSANRDLAVHFVPLLVILAVVLLVTIVGNAFVCYIYRTRFRRNTASFFVVFLAGLEMVFTCFGVSMETAVLALPLMFNSGVTCKIVRYGESAFVCAVLLTLTAIAVDRYGKLNRPTNFLPVKWATRLSIGAVLLALCLALPAPILFGAKTVPTNTPGVTGITCGVEDAMTSSIVRVIYVVSLTFTFVCTVTTMTVLYVLVLVRLCRRQSTTRGERVSPARRGFPRTHRFVPDDALGSFISEDARQTSARPGKASPSLGRASPTLGKVNPSVGKGSPSLGKANPSLGKANPSLGKGSPNLDPARVPLKSGVKESTRIGQRGSATLDVHSTQMTRIFFMVTLVTVLSIIPFVVFRTLQVMSDHLQNMQMLGAVVMYQVCVHLYLLHPAIIPIIYLCCNFGFRREAKHLLQRVGLSCVVRNRQPPSPRCNR